MFLWMIEPPEEYMCIGFSPDG
ncbi:hypothetical protein F383_23607 [Gossypium arboreum]|uniref:Uncharacterized protein n=1 Tax=Gossypium arboreum TaxID=29729 RepID=A0A0B0MSG2_GOSAR|nr:hypothetical protein F383_23607 [Gossypium arboreum]